MLKIQLDEKCIICGHKISATQTIGGQEQLYSDQYWPMRGNRKYTRPFSVWHHIGYDGSDGEPFFLHCNKCGADFYLKASPISLYCSLEYATEEKEWDEIEKEYDEGIKRITFLKWLKKQKSRGDCVGDFANDVFWADDRLSPRKFYRMYPPSYPKRATSYRAWMKLLQGKKHAQMAFKMAWSEYWELRDHWSIVA